MRAMQTRRWYPTDLGSKLKVLLNDKGLHTATGYDQHNDQSGNGVNFTNAVGAQQPATGRKVNTHDAPDYDGSNDSLDTTASGKVLSAITAAAAYEHFGGADIDAITGTSATSYLNDAFIADAGQYWGVFLRKVVGTPDTYFLRLYTWDTNDRRIEVQLAALGKHSFHAWLDGVNINGEVDGVSQTPAACTFIGVRTSLISIGHGSGSTYLNGAWALFFCCDSTLSTYERVLAKHYVACYLGVPA